MSTLNPVFYTGTHIAGAATTAIASPSYGPPTTAAGVLHSVVINTPGTLCTISDAVGVKLALTTTAVGSFVYDIVVQFPLSVVTTGSGTDITVTTLSSTSPFYA